MNFIIDTSGYKDPLPLAQLPEFQQCEIAPWQHSRNTKRFHACVCKDQRTECLSMFLLFLQRPEDDTIDPLDAQNIRLPWRIVAVGVPPWVSEKVVPPVDELPRYDEQGQPRGRKPQAKSKSKAKKIPAKERGREQAKAASSATPAPLKQTSRKKSAKPEPPKPDESTPPLRASAKAPSKRQVSPSGTSQVETNKRRKATKQDDSKVDPPHETSIDKRRKATKHVDGKADPETKKQRKGKQDNKAEPPQKEGNHNAAPDVELPPEGKECKAKATPKAAPKRRSKESPKETAVPAEAAAPHEEGNHNASLNEELAPEEKERKGKATPKAAPKRRSKASPKETAPGEAAPEAKDKEQQQFVIPDDAVPAPVGMPSNLVYSLAYTRAKKVEGSVKSEWQLAGKHASWLLRVHSLVSPDLSGNSLEYNPRTKKAT